MLYINLMKLALLMIVIGYVLVVDDYLSRWRNYRIPALRRYYLLLAIACLYLGVFVVSLWLNILICYFLSGLFMAITMTEAVGAYAEW